ncbi:MAG: serine/threonine protein kinase [Deltaproteobacteria bacterium]|nr:serine/threonine protein kinase [Deltaproteobacteria bacterium]
MGRVYAVEHPHGPLAVKLLHEVLAGDPDMVDRMVGEARAGRRVCHPNVVKIVDQGSVRGGIPFVAMERAGGAPLGIVVQRDGGLPLSRIAAIAMQLLAGLAAIHRALLVHADMKSDNILVDAAHGDRATIIDFGLARAPHASPHRADPKLVSGTPEYMAPELIRGDAVTVAADLYAVGIILYELLTGTTPFCGGTTAEIFERQLRDEVVPPSLRSPDRTIPPALEAVVMRALHKEPAVRFGDAAAMAAAIARALPASCADDTAAPPSRCAASASSPTCDWSRRTQVHRRRRLADGTAPHENGARKAIVARRRDELAAANAGGDPDAIGVACIALADALITEHRLRDAARELETTLATFAARGLAPTTMWCLLLSLAALYDGLGDPARARSSAVAAADAAREARSDVGRSRVNALLRRLDAARTRNCDGRPPRVAHPPVEDP